MNKTASAALKDVDVVIFGLDAQHVVAGGLACAK